MIRFAWDFIRPALPVLALLAALALGAWATYDTGRIHGRAAVQAKWDAERQLAAETRAQELRETAKRMDVLHLEVERLRARPARVKAITEKIYVQADAECRSLPAGLRSLWDAADEAGADSAPPRAEPQDGP